MELAIEIIREASARLPGPLGQTIGIVGGFILGDAAVRAGLISPLTTVVVALTAICSFTSPNFGVAISIRILRFPLVIVALVGAFMASPWPHLSCLSIRPGSVLSGSHFWCHLSLCSRKTSRTAWGGPHSGRC